MADLVSRPLVMGILNVTPDSFFDGGEWFEKARAITRGHEMVDEGADIVDVGGESTRPGADEVVLDEELARVVPVVEALAGRVRVSIDTTKAEVAEAAIAAGATLVNDVSASLWEVAARHGAGWVAMHRRGNPKTMQRDPEYDDVVAEVTAMLLERAGRARDAGVGEVWIDPGIGFGKTVGHNLALLASLDVLVGTGYPVLVGTSRKNFLGTIAPAANGQSAPVGERLAASIATATWAMERGAGMVRVHDVAATVQAASMVGAGRGRGPGMKGKWAAGIPPRNFTWVIKDRLAMSERPGGFAPNHRKVRRQEEIIWLQAQGFTHVLSLLPSSHNLQAYEDRAMPCVHLPLPGAGDVRPQLGDLYREVHTRLTAGDRVLIHQEELGDRVAGVVAGYLLWSERLPTGPQAITVLEHLTGHGMGPSGRELVAFSAQLGPVTLLRGPAGSAPRTG